MAELACLVTGGAGFIGCAISNALVERYDRVVAFDNLHSQVHPSAERPSRLARGVELAVGDLTAPEDVDRLLSALTPVDVIHLAAETGTGQSLLAATRHGMVNVIGTTVLVDALARRRIAPRRVVLASSRAVYGEGQWRRQDGKLFSPGQRSPAQLAAGQWDFPSSTVTASLATNTPTMPISIYGATKLAQEHVLSSWVGAFGGDLVRLRFQNVFGSGQSLANTYTGIVVLFCRLAREGKEIPLYEDGLMLRDFVHIDDVARSIIAALDVGNVSNAVYDIGTGTPVTLAELAGEIADIYGAPTPVVSGDYRLGDVRHAFCSAEEADRCLNWRARVSLRKGLEELARWIDEECHL